MPNPSVFDPRHAPAPGYLPPGTPPSAQQFVNLPESWAQEQARARAAANPFAPPHTGPVSAVDDEDVHDPFDDDGDDSFADPDPLGDLPGDDEEPAPGRKGRKNRKQRRKAKKKRGFLHSRRPSTPRRSGRRGEGAYKSLGARPNVQKPKLQRTVRHVTYTKTEAIAWFVQEPGPWSMRSDRWQRERIKHEALVLSGLCDAGIEQLHRRIVRRPWDVRRWARKHDTWANNPSAPGYNPDRPARLPDVPGALSWDGLIAGQQKALLWNAPTEKIRFWGLYLPQQSPLQQGLSKVASICGDTTKGLRGKINAWADAAAEQAYRDDEELLATLARTMAGRGVKARPARPAELDYLLNRSSLLGMPMVSSSDVDQVGTGDWSETDIAALADAVNPSVVPGEDCVKVSGVVAGRKMTGYATVLTIGQMGDLPIPESMLPWQVIADSIDSTVEWSDRFSLVGRRKATAEIARQADFIVAQWNQYEEHNQDPPRELRRQYNEARKVKDQLDNATDGLTVRSKGVYRMAVTGSTPDEVRQKVALIREVYEPTIQIYQEQGQYHLLREFMPGEQQANTAHTRRMPVQTLAAGMGAVGDRIGDQTGIPIGETASIAARPVCWDPWKAQEVKHKSGLTPLVAVPGGGKTFLAGVITYLSVRAGAYAVVLDPSGPLRKLATLPELRKFSRVHELTGRSRPGSLNLYDIIADPDPADDEYNPDNIELYGEYPDLEDRKRAAKATYDQDMSQARAERIETAVSVLNMMLRPRTQGEQYTYQVLQRAAQTVGGEREHNLREVLAEIDKISRDLNDASLTPEIRANAGQVYSELDGMSDLASARVLFPPRDGTAAPSISEELRDPDIRLTILTMPGLQLPDEHANPDTYTADQRMTGPLMHVAQLLATRLTYQLPRSWRKLLFLDENKYLTTTGAGRTLYMRVARDSRKYNVRCLASSQLPQDFLVGGEDEAALAYEVFIGDLGGNEAAIKGALKLLGLPEGRGYEATIANLGGGGEETLDEYVNRDDIDDQARRFVVKMADDINLIRCDWTNWTHLGHLFDALRSDPTASRRSFAAREEAVA